MRRSASPFNKNYNYLNTRFEGLPEVNCFCNQRSPCHKTQFEDILARFQVGFNTHTGLTKHQNVFDAPKLAEDEVSKNEPPLITVDIRSKKNYYQEMIVTSNHT